VAVNGRAGDSAATEKRKKRSVMADNDSVSVVAAAATCWKLHSIFDETIPSENQTNSTASHGNASLPSSLSPNVAFKL